MPLRIIPYFLSVFLSIWSQNHSFANYHYNFILFPVGILFNRLTFTLSSSFFSFDLRFRVIKQSANYEVVIENITTQITSLEPVHVSASFHPFPSFPLITLFLSNVSSLQVTQSWKCFNFLHSLLLQDWIIKSTFQSFPHFSAFNLCVLRWTNPMFLLRITEVKPTPHSPTLLAWFANIDSWVHENWSSSPRNLIDGRFLAKIKRERERERERG